MATRNYNPTNGSNSNNGSNGSTTPPVTPTVSNTVKKDLPKGISDMHLEPYRKVLFRENEVFNVLTTLNKVDKPNALIIGQAGSGKTAIASEIVHLIETKDPILPKKLANKHIYKLSLNSLGSGNSLVGQTEAAIEAVIEFATDPANNAILFIDEVHQLFENTSYGQNAQLSQALKPAMARSNFRFIGATTTSESKTILKDPAMSRRIDTVKLHKLTIHETSEIILSALDTYRKEQDVIIENELVPDIIKLADQNYLKSARPDNALTLIDQASSFKSMKWHQLTAPLPDSAIIALPATEKTVTKDTLLETIHNNTGVLTSIKPTKLFNKLEHQVKGQSNSLKKIADEITLFKSNIIPGKTPLSMLLAGPTGNGKTETAKSITRELFHDLSNLTTINMTEYSESASVSQLIGSSDGYIGSDSKRPTPFDAVFENPSQILLLDEFEKAHKDIQHLFYQILDEGFLEDRRGRRIDFSNSILIFTSNAETTMPTKVGFKDMSTSSNESNRAELISALSQYIPDALLNRMTSIYKYNAISKDSYKNILQTQYTKLLADLSDNRPDMSVTPVKLTQEMLDAWADDSFNPKLNGRPARQYVKNKVSEATLDAILNNSSTINIQ